MCVDCSELKTRQKMRKKEEEKKAKDESKKLKAQEEAKTKEAKGEIAPAKKKPVEEELDPTKYTENRKNTLQSLRDQNVNPYPHKF